MSKDKIIEKQLLIVIIADLEQLDYKKKLIMFTKVFSEIYNKQIKKLIYKTYKIVKLQKYLTLKTENFLNLGNQQFYKISEILQSTYIVKTLG